jgi:nitrate/TMAO reductase-like tetraheme cytochrome c subunit
MKKFLIATVVIVFAWSCAKKATPAKSETGTTTTATTITETKTTVSTELLAAGKTTYEAKCGRCHALHATDEFTAEKWVPYVDAMAPKAKLTDSEKANVLAYVQANAKK